MLTNSPRNRWATVRRGVLEITAKQIAEEAALQGAAFASRINVKATPKKWYDLSGVKLWFTAAFDPAKYIDNLFMAAKKTDNWNADIAGYITEFEGFDRKLASLQTLRVRLNGDMVGGGIDWSRYTTDPRSVFAELGIDTLDTAAVFAIMKLNPSTAATIYTGPAPDGTIIGYNPVMNIIHVNKRDIPNGDIIIRKLLKTFVSFLRDVQNPETDATASTHAVRNASGMTGGNGDEIMCLCCVCYGIFLLVQCCVEGIGRETARNRRDDWGESEPERERTSPPPNARMTR